MAVTPGSDPLRVNLSWLIRLRWGAIAGQALTTVAVDRFMDVPLPLGLLGALIGVELVTNVGATVWARRGRGGRAGRPPPPPPARAAGRDPRRAHERPPARHVGGLRRGGGVHRVLPDARDARPRRPRRRAGRRAHGQRARRAAGLAGPARPRRRPRAGSPAAGPSSTRPRSTPARTPARGRCRWRWRS